MIYNVIGDNMINADLNDRQRYAVFHNKGPMMVLSGPGSGKTMVIIHRVNVLVSKYNVDPSSILVITFTKAASIEMKERFYKSFNNIYGVNFGTFHSYFFRIIKSYYKYEVSDIIIDNDKIKILKNIIYSLDISFDDEEEFLQDIINEISLVKNELIPPILFDSKITDSNSFYLIYKQYEAIKEKEGKIDFDDMLIKCYNLLRENNQVREFWQNKYKYILIDEFQDCNKVQYECIKMLVSDECNLFIVGDDDQSIYGFRGSKPDYLLNFPNEFNNVEKVVLNTNYRSTEQIINLSNHIISENKTRYEKNIIGTKRYGKCPILLRCYDINEEAKIIVDKINKFKNKIPLEQIAIIYRTNIQARAIVEELMNYNMDFQIKDLVPSIYEHFIARDIFAYLTLAMNPLEYNCFLRIANKPKRFLSKDLLNQAKEISKNGKSILKNIYSIPDIKNWQIEKISELEYHLSNIKNKKTYDAIKYILKIVGYEEYIESYSEFKKIKSDGLFDIANEILESSKSYDDILVYLTHIEDIRFELKENSYKIDNQKGIVLTTMHSAKGLEFDLVFVIGCVEDIIPHKKSISKEEIEEERRLFYVALTRAKNLLYISVVENRYEVKVKPSRFLNKLIKNKG